MTDKTLTPEQRETFDKITHHYLRGKPDEKLVQIGHDLWRLSNEVSDIEKFMGTGTMQNLPLLHPAFDWDNVPDDDDLDGFEAARQMQNYVSWAASVILLFELPDFDWDLFIAESDESIKYVDGMIDDGDEDRGAIAIATTAYIMGELRVKLVEKFCDLGFPFEVSMMLATEYIDSKKEEEK